MLFSLIVWLVCMYVCILGQVSETIIVPYTTEESEYSDYFKNPFLHLGRQRQLERIFD